MQKINPQTPQHQASVTNSKQNLKTTQSALLLHSAATMLRLKTQQSARQRLKLK
jgi:hypothetical protein